MADFFKISIGLIVDLGVKTLQTFFLLPKVVQIYPLESSYVQYVKRFAFSFQHRLLKSGHNYY